VGAGVGAGVGVRVGRGGGGEARVPPQVVAQPPGHLELPACQERGQQGVNTWLCRGVQGVSGCGSRGGVGFGRQGCLFKWQLSTQVTSSNLRVNTGAGGSGCPGGGGGNGHVSSSNL
jgi:hypothetical protein